MIRICSYCHENLGETPPLNDPAETHGICAPCRDHFVAQWSGMRLGEYLDRFSKPVLAVNEKSIVVAANSAMAALVLPDGW